MKTLSMRGLEIGCRSGNGSKKMKRGESLATLVGLPLRLAYSPPTLGTHSVLEESPIVTQRSFSSHVSSGTWLLNQVAVFCNITC